MAMKSLGQKIKQITALIGTKDVSPWEESFLESIKKQTSDGEFSTRLTANQAEVVERIYEKHFV